jgi:hypothetical protein
MPNEDKAQAAFDNFVQSWTTGTTAGVAHPCSDAPTRSVRTTRTCSSRRWTASPLTDGSSLPIRTIEWFEEHVS